MLGKAVWFATVCTLAFAICGRANRDKGAADSEGASEDLGHRSMQETDFEDQRKPSSKTSLSSGMRRLAVIAALSSALTADAFTSPGVQPFGIGPFQKVINTAFAPILTSNPILTGGGGESAPSAATRIFSSGSTEEALNPRLSGLAIMLDEGTRKSHSLAENTAFVTGFFKGLSTREAYRNLLTSLYFVYTAMEESFDASDLPAVKSLDDAELRRVGALETDMDYFYGREWRGTIAMSENTKRYVQRVREVAKEKPYLLVAHQYTRYLGDLFGGQMMGGMAKRSLSLDDGKGVAFYTFDDIPNATEFITDWYKRLNDLDLTDVQKEEIIDEANLVFDLNIGLFEDLEGSPLRAAWTLTINTLKDKLGLGSS